MTDPVDIAKKAQGLGPVGDAQSRQAFRKKSFLLTLGIDPRPHVRRRVLI
jgi:hypothetical protein